MLTIEDLIEETDRTRPSSPAWKVDRLLGAAHASLIEARGGGGVSAVHDARRRLDGAVVLIVELCGSVAAFEYTNPVGGS